MSLLRLREMAGRVAALDRSLAVIEFMPDGRIVTANANFLATMGYRLDEIRGHHHSMFVTPADRDSAAYKTFWQALRDGAFQTAEFRRVTKDGREVWLQATYTPIRSFGGRTRRVVKFASDITEAKRRSAEDSGKAAAIGRSAAVIEFTLDGIVLDANQNFLDTMGYRLDEIAGRHHSMFVDAATCATPAYAALWRELGQGAFKSAEFKRIAKDGHAVWLQASYNPILDAAGLPTKVVKFATDITARKLRDAETAGQIAAIGRSQAVIEFALDGTILTANANFLAAVGYALHEVQGQHHRMFVEPDEQRSPSYLQFWERLRDGAFATGEYRRLAKGGTEIWLQASYNPILDAEGKPFKVVKFATDITEEVARRKRVALLSLVADGTNNSVVITGPDRLIQYVNPGFCNMSGYTHEEAMGRKPGDLSQGQPTDVRTIARICEKIGAGQPFYDEILNYKKSGEPYWISLSINPVFDAAGKLEHFVSVQADITATKLAGLEAEARLNAIAQSSLLMEWDADQQLAYLNEVARHRMGLDDPAAAGAAYRLDAVLDTADLQGLREARSVMRELEFRDATGESLFISATIQPLRDAEGCLATHRPIRRGCHRPPSRRRTDGADHAFSSGRDRCHFQKHPGDQRANQPAGAECDDRGRPCRRGRARFRRGRQRGEVAGAALLGLDRPDLPGGQRHPRAHRDADRRRLTRRGPLPRPAEASLGRRTSPAARRSSTPCPPPPPGLSTLSASASPTFGHGSLDAAHVLCSCFVRCQPSSPHLHPSGRRPCRASVSPSSSTGCAARRRHGWPATGSSGRC